jgi:hypothetical protein
MKETEIINLKYCGKREATIRIKWFDNYENKWIYMVGLVEEVEE